MKIKHNGIFDPEGKYKNPLTGKPYTKNYFNHTNFWSNLEVYKYREEFLEKLHSSRVLIVEAGTGVGKTVIIPKLALHSLDYKGRVLMTMPKVEPTVSATKFAIETLDIPFESGGDIIGYRYRGGQEDGHFANDKTKITYATDGMAINMIKSNPSFDQYDIVIVDEVHERSVNIDIILLLLKGALEINPKLKLILMSATLPKDLFQNYYRKFGIQEIMIKGKSTFPVELKYLPTFGIIKDLKQRDLDVQTFEFFKRFLQKEGQKYTYIMIFLPTTKQIYSLMDMITREYPSYKIFPITSSTIPLYDNMVELPIEKISEMDQKIYTKSIIISTNVWESSKTLKNLEVVIDNGYENKVTYDPKDMTTNVGISYVSKGQAIQRKGRVGRNKPGICYRLYTEKTYHTFLDDPIPPILSENIFGTLFELVKLLEEINLGNLVKKIDQLIQPPPKEIQKIYLRLMYDMGLFKNWESHAPLSSLGELTLRVNAGDVFNLRKSLILSQIYNCKVEMSIMIAILNKFSQKSDVTYLFDIPRDKFEEERYLKKINNFRDKRGELFSIFKVVNTYFEHQSKNRGDNLEQFIRRNGINQKICQDIIDIATDIYSRWFQTGRKKLLYEDDKMVISEDRVLYCLLSAYFYNICRINDKDGKFYNFYPKDKSKVNFNIDDKHKYIFCINLMKSFGKVKPDYVIPVDKRLINLLPTSEKYFIINRRSIRI